MNKKYIADPVIIHGYLFNIPISFDIIKALGEACSREPHFITVSSWNEWASIVKSGVEFVGALSALLPDVMSDTQGTVEEQIERVMMRVMKEARQNTEQLRSLVWCKTKCKEGDFVSNLFSDLGILKVERIKLNDSVAAAQAKLVDVDNAIEYVKLAIVGIALYMKASPNYKNRNFDGSDC